jgi:ABC-type glycerol-3-phosphate transport system substrate-binding protein
MTKQSFFSIRRKKSAGCAISAGLSLIMCISLTGCFTPAGKPGETDKTVAAGEVSGNYSAAEAVTGETVSSDEVYFSSKSIDFYEQKEGEECNVLSVTPCGDRLAVLINVLCYTDTEYASIEYSNFYVLLYSTDGVLESSTDISSYVGTDGYVMAAAADRDGNLGMLVSAFDESTGVSAYELLTLNTSGKAVGEPPVLAFDEGFYPTSMIFAKDGSICFSGQRDKACILVMDKNGQKLYEIMDESLEGFLYKDGDKIYSGGWEETNGVYKPEFYEILVPEKKLGEAIDMTAFKDGDISAGFDGLYLSDSYGVYKMDLKAGQKTEVFEYDQADAIPYSKNCRNQYYVLAKDKLLMINTEYTNGFDGSVVTAALLSREAVNPNAGKEIIVLGGIGLAGNSDISKAVYDFNRESTEYRIEIRDYDRDADYSGASTYDEYTMIQSDRIRAMNLDILSGTGPDIVYGINENTSNLESQGFFVDLNTLMEKDSGFKKDDYLSGIFKLCETDGKLYKIPTKFLIYGLAGAQSVIGDRTGWTLDEFNEVADSLPADMAMMPKSISTTQSNLLKFVLSGNMTDLINYKTGEVSLDSDVFRGLLAFSRTYGVDDDTPQDVKDNWVDPIELVRNGDFALVIPIIHNPGAYSSLVSVFGEPVSVTGFPSANGAGPMCSITDSFSISSESANIDACWSFIKSLLSEEAQRTIVSSNYGIPVLKSAFEEQIDQAMNPSEDGVPVFINEQQVPLMTEEMARGYRALVDSLNVIMIPDYAVNAIIMDEVPAYFNGQKTDTAVSALIQNRVETLVKERS